MIKYFRWKDLAVLCVIIPLGLFSIRSGVVFYQVPNDHLTEIKSSLSVDQITGSQVPSHGRRGYDILLLGYLRGGTTFLGEILGLHKGSFYVYEPLYEMTQFGYIKHGHVCNMEDSRCRSVAYIEQMALRLLRDIYNCDVLSIKGKVRLWQLVKATGLTGNWTDVLKECQGQEIGCLDRVFSRCPPAESRVIKVARISMTLVSELLTSLPHLKVIHLIRDPRAIMNSRYRLWLRNTRDLMDACRSLCRKMEVDYVESDRLKRKYPERIHRVFYEDLAVNPATVIKKLFDFVGYRVNEEDTVRVQSMTSARVQVKKSQRDYTTHVLNSTKTARKWRTDGSGVVVALTEQVCSSLYDKMGYPHFIDTKQLRNPDIPLRTILK